METKAKIRILLYSVWTTVALTGAGLALAMHREWPAVMFGVAVVAGTFLMWETITRGPND